MKSIAIIAVLSTAFASLANAAEYSPYPKPGVYSGTDQQFERELTIQSNGKFTLEVMQKGKAGNLRSGSGEGKLADAPGGWDFSEGRCSMTLKRASGGMKLHVEGCSGSWGDVPFDGLYKPANGADSAANESSNSKTTASAATTGNLPSRKELLNHWMDLQVFTVAGKNITAMAKPMAGDPKLAQIEKYAQAAFIIDVSSNYAAMSANDQAKSPVNMVNIPLPKLAANEGILFQAGCTSGKLNNVIAINVSRQQGNNMQSHRASAWMLDSSFQAKEVKPASKVKCPEVSSEY